MCTSENNNRTKNTPDALVKVLGSGCKKCIRLEANAKQALASLGMEPLVEHITDLSQIVSYGVMATPALVIGQKVVSMGKVLRSDEIKTLLEKNL